VPCAGSCLRRTARTRSAQCCKSRISFGRSSNSGILCSILYRCSFSCRDHSEKKSLQELIDGCQVVMCTVTGVCKTRVCALPCELNFRRLTTRFSGTPLCLTWWWSTRRRRRSKLPVSSLYVSLHRSLRELTGYFVPKALEGQEAHSGGRPQAASAHHSFRCMFSPL
jgi:hypothetical protein